MALGWEAAAGRPSRQVSAAAAVAAHIAKFWDPRMREMIVAHLHAGGEGLSDIARQAVAKFATRSKNKTPSR